MKTLRYILLLISLYLTPIVFSQDAPVTPERTPEQEATRQTEKLQQELNLSPDQTKQIYDINLRYARERQASNTRMQAIERMKNKDADLQRVLTQDQYTRLQNKRFERSTFQSPAFSPGVPSNASTLRSSDNRQQEPARQTSTNQNVRTEYRTTVPFTGSRTQQPSFRSTNPGRSSYSAPRSPNVPGSRSGTFQGTSPATPAPTRSLSSPGSSGSSSRSSSSGSTSSGSSGSGSSRSSNSSTTRR